MTITNGQSTPCSSVVTLDWSSFTDQLHVGVSRGSRISAYFATNESPRRLIAVLANAAHHDITLLATLLSPSIPSLTSSIPELHWFERELIETHEMGMEGHPWPKPIRFSKRNEIGRTSFYSVEGDAIHEVAVGPVHAGVIEPGHFRFQCHGELVHHLEISLGYQHRGIESQLIHGPHPMTLHYMETLAGDTSIGHSWCYTQLVEAMSGIKVPSRASTLRAIALELERCANHTGDLGALAGDVAFLPTASYCGRLRGDFLNLTASLCGNRFGRGMVRVGGVAFSPSEKEIRDFLTKLAATESDVRDATDHLWSNMSVQMRFEHTGTVSQETAHQLGLVGPAARASNINIDTRRDFPFGPYADRVFSVPLAKDGDVNARAKQRRLEIDASIDLIRSWMSNLPAGDYRTPTPLSLPANHIAVSLIEGWRGEIAHVGITNDQGKFSTYKIVDPSFHNWMGLAMALRNQQIFDFPLCNKSFNLSYCGHDL